MTGRAAPRPTARRRSTALAAWPGLVIAAVLVWAMLTTEADLSKLGAAGPRLGDFLGRMIPPDFSIWPEVWQGLMETLRIAVIGTFGCVVLSAVLAPLAADTVAPAWVTRPVRAALALMRAVPLILVAILMVSAVGLGPLPGILAIVLHGTGMLAKFYAEAIEDVARAPVAALDSAGATLVQRLRFAVWPQMAPVVLRDTIFRFELNLRESLILGIVGAGGIGFYIQTYIRSFQYPRAATVTLAVVAIVIVIELVNAALRRRVT